MKIKEFGEITTIIMNWVAMAAAAGGLYIYACGSYNSYIIEGDKKFVGDWTTNAEFCDECREPPGPPITITLDAKDGAVRGELNDHDYISALLPKMSNKTKLRMQKKQLASSIAASKELTEDIAMLSSPIIYGYLFLEGKRHWDYAIVDLTFIVAGQVHLYGHAKIAVHGYDMNWELLDSTNPYLPKRATFHRAMPITEDSPSTTTGKKDDR